MTQPPSGFQRIICERNGRSSRNLVYVNFEQFYSFPENFQSGPTMTFDHLYKMAYKLTWPYVQVQGHVKRNLRSVPFQCLKLSNFGIFAGDMDMDRCYEVTSVIYTDIVTIPMSNEVIRSQLPLITSHVIFRVCVPPGIAWCATFEFGIRLSFIQGVSENTDTLFRFFLGT